MFVAVLQAGSNATARAQARSERKANAAMLNLTEGLSHLQSRCVFDMQFHSLSCDNPIQDKKEKHLLVLIASTKMNLSTLVLTEVDSCCWTTKMCIIYSFGPAHPV